ncbi:site-specific DNA-methyltransferase, partial [Hydrogenivirga sp. 128-5-R1-1]|uniref:site-specific DNA-methyltransferase n=1 Tax=Hydrogenivirga sp. 128-5-R1-1 TaxID=392423 RepID=UPI00015F39BE
DNDPRGAWVADNLAANGKGGRLVESLIFPIINPNTGEEHYPPKGACWRYSKEKIEELIKDNRIYFGKDGKGRPKLKRFLSEVRQGETASTIWDDVNYTVHASKFLEKLFKTIEVFDNPKPIELIEKVLRISSNPNSLILDFFAGSGTTAHAVMKLNNEDRGDRKFILIEMADYFETVIIPRIKKVAYSFNWKEGKPQDSEGKGVFFKYHTLEQYEDSLENIEFENAKDTKLQTQQGLIQQALNLKPNQVIKYKLDQEAKKLLDIENLKDPFNYKIKILDTKNTQKSEYKTVDLIETFIYLANLKVEKIFKQNDYTLIIGKQDNLKILAVFQKEQNKNPEQIAKEINQLIETYKPEKLFINLLEKTPILNKEVIIESIENLFIETMS